MTSQSSDKRPNVLFVISDEHNAKVMGCAGHPDVQTPSMDRLAAEGVMFERAITQSPICTPTRASIYSGQYCLNHGYYGLSGPAESEPDLSSLPNLFARLQSAGYATGVAGKIHTPTGWLEPHLDFGKFNEHYHRHVEEIGGYYNEAVGRYDDSHLPMSKTGPGSFGHDGGPSPMPYEETFEGWSARTGIEFLDRFGDRPFFLQVGFKRPHSPYTPAKRFWDMYDEESIALPPNADYDMSLKPPHLRAKRQSLEGLGERWAYEPKTYEAGRQRNLRAYLGCVTQADYALGELLQALEERGLAENTIVIYSTDHGQYAIEHGIIEKAPGISSDAVTRIPMIWRWPDRVAAGRRCERLVEWVDFAPTICALLGIEDMNTVDGCDITPLLKGGNEPLRDVAVTECPWSRSIRDERWRYVHYQPEMFGMDDYGELYDLENDPWEMNNLYFEAAYQDKVNEMRHRLLDWLVKKVRIRTTLPSLNRGGEPFRHQVDEDGRIGEARVRQLVAKGSISYL